MRPAACYRTVERIVKVSNSRRVWQRENYWAKYRWSFRGSAVELSGCVEVYRAGAWALNDHCAQPCLLAPHRKSFHRQIVLQICLVSRRKKCNMPQHLSICGVQCLILPVQLDSRYLCSASAATWGKLWRRALHRSLLTSEPQVFSANLQILVQVN